MPIAIRTLLLTVVLVPLMVFVLVPVLVACSADGYDRECCAQRDGELEGRVVLITGASSGIGKATALACAEAGASVVLGARCGDRLRGLVAAIERASGRALSVATALPMKAGLTA